MKLFDLLNILAFVTIFTGVVTGVNWFLKCFSKYKVENKKTNIIIEYSRSLFPVLLIVLIVRTFLFQPYSVPTGSLEPTVMPGDLIVVTQYNYGLKIPLWDHIIIPINHPQRGQIAVFHWPVNPLGATLVKRVIGLPGDRISYIDKVLYINGKPMTQKFIKNAMEVDDNGLDSSPVKQYEENLNGIKHFIFIRPDQLTQNFVNLVVPQGEYFMMGDNRDDSDDSRSWGFVPLSSFIGQAQFIWFNIKFSPFKIRWDRIGTRVSVADKTSYN